MTTTKECTDIQNAFLSFARTQPYTYWIDKESLTLETFSQQVNNPDFQYTGWAPYWFRHIPLELKEIWNQLSLETKMAVYCVAQNVIESRQ